MILTGYGEPAAPSVPPVETAYSLLKRLDMEFVCRHCDKLISGTPYRVMSREEGVILLDMIVCHACYTEARNLGLQAEEIRFDTASRKISAFN